MTHHPSTGDPIADTEAWFLEHGLSYFVPGERAAARAALTRRRILPALAVVAVVAATLGGLLGWFSEQAAAAPAVLLTVVGAAALHYALTALHARPIVGWALKRTLSSLDFGTLWLTALLLLGLGAVFGFLLVFGSLVVNEDVQLAWTAREATSHIPGLNNVSAELVKVSLFLASFSGLYFTVSAVTDETYRGQFFAAVMVHLERAVGVRAVYLALREREGHGAPWV